MYGPKLVLGTCHSQLVDAHPFFEDQETVCLVESPKSSFDIQISCMKDENGPSTLHMK